MRKLLILCLLFNTIINLNSVYAQKTKAGFTKWISEKGQSPTWTIFGQDENTITWLSGKVFENFTGGYTLKVDDDGIIQLALINISPPMNTTTWNFQFYDLDDYSYITLIMSNEILYFARFFLLSQEEREQFSELLTQKIKRPSGMLETLSKSNAIDYEFKNYTCSMNVIANTFSDNTLYISMMCTFNLR